MLLVDWRKLAGPAPVMRFTLLLLAACQTCAMRPELKRAALSKGIARIGDIMSQISTPTQPLKELSEATSVLNEILAESGNATEHMSDTDQELLRSVIKFVEDTLYETCDAAHVSNNRDLRQAIGAVHECNADIDRRQSDGGDLGDFKSQTRGQQTELNRRSGGLQDARSVHDT